MPKNEQPYYRLAIHYLTLNHSELHVLNDQSVDIPQLMQCLPLCVIFEKKSKM